MPLPTMTTRLTAVSYAKPGTVATFPGPGLSGLSATVTGPVARTQHAMRVFSARPSRSSVACSASDIGDVPPMQSLRATGLAPQMPMRQPASICIPLASATSSSDIPGSGTTRLPSGWNVISGRAAVEGVVVGGVTALVPGAERSRNGFSLSSVRTNQVAASAIAAPLIAQWISGGAKAAANQEKMLKAPAPNSDGIVCALVL